MNTLSLSLVTANRNICPPIYCSSVPVLRLGCCRLICSPLIAFFFFFISACLNISLPAHLCLSSAVNFLRLSEIQSVYTQEHCHARSEMMGQDQQEAKGVNLLRDP